MPKWGWDQVVFKHPYKIRRVTIWVFHAQEGTGAEGTHKGRGTFSLQGTRKGEL